MSQYRAPLAEMRFVMTELAGLDEARRSCPGFEDATPDTVTAILEEADKFATDVLDPLNRVGDREGARLADDGRVTTPAGFSDAYRAVLRAGLERAREERRHSAGRACRSSSPRRSTRCGTRRTWRSSYARC